MGPGAPGTAVATSGSAMLLLVALALPVPAQRAGPLDRARAALTRAQLDSAEAWVQAVLAAGRPPRARERAEALVLRALIHGLRGQDSAASAALHDAFRTDPDAGLGDLAPLWQELAVRFATERLRWRYADAGRPLDPADTLPLESPPDEPPVPERLPVAEYPDRFSRDAVEADVLVVAIVDTRGRVRRPWLEVAYETTPGFAHSAMAAALAARFRPAERGGHPVAALTRIPVRYRVLGGGGGRPASALLEDARRRLVGRDADTAAAFVREALDPEMGAPREQRAAGFVLLAVAALLRGDTVGGADDLRVALALDSAHAVDTLAVLHPALAALAARVRQDLGASDTTRVREVGRFDEAPGFISGSPTWYPSSLLYPRDSALGHPVQGRVVMELVIDTTGRVDPSSVVVVSRPDTGLDLPAFEFALKARFRPGRIAGRPVRVRVRLPLEFRTAPVFLETMVDTRPEIVSGPHLIYPEPLRRAWIQGRVLVEAIVDTFGVAERRSIRVVSSPHPGFNQVAQGWMRLAYFRPARAQGRAVRVVVRVPIDFKLRGS